MRKVESDVGVTRSGLVDPGVKRRSPPITFRVGEAHQGLIEARAQMFGQTTNRYAKQVVVRDLEQRSFLDAVHREIAALRREVATLRQDVRRLLKRRESSRPFRGGQQPVDPLGELALPPR